MADLKEAFPVTADDSTGAGISPISRVSGDASAAKAGLIGFSFKDSSGNVILPSLNAAGALPVAFAPSNNKFDYGTHAGSTSIQDIAVLDETVIAAGKVYEDFGISVTSFRESVFTLVYIDDAGGTPVESILGVWRVGPGQYTVIQDLPAVFVDTTGGTGDQNFVLRGLNLDHASTMNAQLSCKERV